MHTENNTATTNQYSASKSGFDSSLRGEQVIKTIKISEWIENPKGTPIIIKHSPVDLSGAGQFT